MLLWIRKQNYQSSVRTVPGNSDSSRRAGILEGFSGCCWGSDHEATSQMLGSMLAPCFQKRYVPLPECPEAQVLWNRRCCFAEMRSYLLCCFAGIPVIVIKQFLGDAQIGGLHFGKPLLLDQAVAHTKGWFDQRMGQL